LWDTAKVIIKIDTKNPLLSLCVVVVAMSDLKIKLLSLNSNNYLPKHLPGGLTMVVGKEPSELKPGEAVIAEIKYRNN